MNNTKEKVKLDEVLKYLFTTSNKVLINLLNAIFEENFKEDEVDLTIIYTAKITGKQDIIKWVLSMGTAVTILEPETLKEEIKEILKNMIDLI